MNSPFRTALLGVMLGAVTQGLFSCGTTAAVPTSFFVTVVFNPQLGTSSMVFNGLGPNNVQYFPTTRLPAIPDPNLKSPQTVRILMPDALDGVEVNIDIVGIDDNEDTVESLTIPATVRKGKEVTVLATLVPLTSRLDAGTMADAGAVDAGVLDAGQPGDGGVIMCTCTTGCCEVGKSTCAKYLLLDSTTGGGRVPVQQFGCGNIGGTCTSVCNSFTSTPPTSSTCAAGTPCSCGTGAPCTAGTRCDNGRCVCDALSCPGPQLVNPNGSNAAGCCTQAQGRAVCLQSISTTQCGNTGLQCDDCGGRACTQKGLCGATCSAETTKCCSGSSTEDISFPRCRTAAGTCSSCDWVRSTQCGPLNVDCMCGTGAQCGPGYRCTRTSAVAPYACVRN